MKILLSIYLIFSFSIANAMSADAFGTLTRVQGEAYKLFYPSKKPSGPGPHFFFRGLHYSVAPMRVGDRFVPGNLIRTGKHSAVRVVFNYGDLINLGAESFLGYSTKSVKEKSLTILKLELGKMRTLIKSGGKLAGLRIETAHLMGDVSGAEFYLRAFPKESFLGVLRGTLDIWGVLKGGIKKVKPPVSITINSQGEMGDALPLSVAQILSIQSATDVSISSLNKAVLKTQVRLKELEGEAYDSFLEDLAASNTDWYKEFKLGKYWKTVDGLLAFTVEKGVFLAQDPNVEKPEELQPINKFYLKDD